MDSGPSLAMDNRSEVSCCTKGFTAENNLESEEDLDLWEKGNDICLVEKEMGIRRRKRRSLHGRDLHVKISQSPFNELSSAAVYASCLEISDENVLSKIMEGCTNVEEMIMKLKDQTISLTKKRCIKRKLTPVRHSKILKLTFSKKVKYRMAISYSKLKIGFRNFFYSFELWYSSLKLIEGKFGSSVATYFTFLRKLFILNSLIFLFIFFFTILPQVLFVQFTKHSAVIVGNESSNLLKTVENNGVKENNALMNLSNIEEEGLFFFPLIRNENSYFYNSNMRLGNLFTGMGYLSGSILFYGHYFNSSFSLSSNYSYDLPSGYFFSIAFCYFLVLYVLFFSVAESYKKCYIETSNGGKNVFSEKIFCGWDFGIAKSDAEELKYCSIHMELKELLNESNRGMKNNYLFGSFYTAMIRLSLNMIILLLLIALGWYTSTYLDLHMDYADVPTIMMLMLTLTLVATLAPAGFSWLSRVEYYDDPRTALYVTLVRTFILHILIIIIIVAHRVNGASKITCWETVVGQDVYRLIVLDFFVGLGENMVEFIRSRMNKKWERIERPEFNIALNTMNLIYNQALLYVGLYFSPGLSFIVSCKMFLTFYLKKWGAMYNCQPSKKPWKAAQTQTVFLSFAFLVFFGIIVGYGYIFTRVKTSNCGPFGGGKFVFEAVLYEIFHEGVKSTSLVLLSHFLRSGVVVIILLIMILAIYYLRSVNLVRRHIVKNLRLIIKEQVAYKKKLLARIKEAQEEYKSGLIHRTTYNSKNGIGCKRLRSVDDLPFLIGHVDDSSSDIEDRGEEFPLQKKSAISQINMKTRNRLCRSTYNLNAVVEPQGGKSREKLGLCKSLQNLSPQNCILDFMDSKHMVSVPKSDIDGSSISAHSMNSMDDESGILFSGISLKNNKDINCDRGNHELLPVNGSNKKCFSYDERVPSRIYFDRNRKQKT